MSLDQIVSWSFDGSAMAWAGPIAVWPWNWKSYSASTTFAALANAASGFPTTFGSGLDVGVVLRMYLYRSSEVGKDGVAGFCQLTASCVAALIACSSRSQTTAT